jgi:hypothetical protein
MVELKEGCNHMTWYAPRFFFLISPLSRQYLTSCALCGQPMLGYCRRLASLTPPISVSLPSKKKKN